MLPGQGGEGSIEVDVHTDAVNGSRFDGPGPPEDSRYAESTFPGRSFLATQGLGCSCMMGAKYGPWPIVASENDESILFNTR